MTATDQTNHFWLAEEYHHHSSAQKRAATELLKILSLKGTERILDVGCGDGKISAAIAASLSKGTVLGIDRSQEMINFAKNSFQKNEHQNLKFMIQDAQALNCVENFDVIFSSFALQWLPSPELFFRGAFECLTSSGYLAITIPLCISLALEHSTKTITSLPEWQRYFQKFSPGWHFVSETRYSELLAKHNFSPIHFSKTLQIEKFPSREALEKYITPWFSYLNCLPEDLKKPFFKQVIDSYLEIEPAEKDGTVSFRFSRVDIVAKKNPTL